MTAAESSTTSRSQITIGRIRPEDRETLERMYADVFGEEAHGRSRERWRWQYENNPHCPPEGPEIWVAKEAGEVLGQYATMPIRLKVKQRMLRASWGMDVMVKPNLQKKGVGTRLFDYWDQHVEAPLGLGLSLASYTLFQKLGWEDVGPVPCHSKPLDTGALLARRVGHLPAKVLSSIAGAVLRLAYPEPSTDRGIEIRRLEGPFHEAFDQLWDEACPGYDFVAERKSRYLEWKYHEIPYVAYDVFQAFRDQDLVGYVVLRATERNRVRLGLVVDLFAHPEDTVAVDTLIDWTVVWGRQNRVARLQTFTFDERWTKRLRRKGFFGIKSPMQFCLHIHSDHVDEMFFRDTSRWHVTFGDSDMDREP